MMLPVNREHVAKGRRSFLQLVGLLCSEPARVLGIRAEEHTGVGYAAELTRADLGVRREIERGPHDSRVGRRSHSFADARGRPVATSLAGHVAMRERAIPDAPRGRPVEFCLPAS